MALRMPPCSVSRPRWLGRQAEQSGHVQGHTPIVQMPPCPVAKRARGTLGRHERTKGGGKEIKEERRKGEKGEKLVQELTKLVEERQPRGTKTSMDHALSRHHHQRKDRADLAAK